MIASPSAASGADGPRSVLVDGRLWTPATAAVWTPLTPVFGDCCSEPPGTSTIGLTAPTAFWLGALSNPRTAPLFAVSERRKITMPFRPVVVAAVSPPPPPLLVVVVSWPPVVPVLVPPPVPPVVPGPPSTQKTFCLFPPGADSVCGCA